jgi:predicted SAM-dependent methyltransferase
MNLLVVLQSHSKGDNHVYEGYMSPEQKRYTGASKLETSKRCSKSLINSLNNFYKVAPNFEIELQIFDDHSDDEYLNCLEKYLDKALFKYNINKMNKSGISASMLCCYQYGKENGKELVYFAQDDYMHEPNAIEEMAEFFFHWSTKLDKPLSIYPFNDPYRYADVNIHPVRIVHGKKRHWRQNYATAFPFMVHHSVLIKEFDLFYAMGCHKIDNKMEDDTINKLFQERGYCLFSPIPSLAFHMQYETEKDPFVDYKPLWNSLADENKKDYSTLFKNNNKKVLNIGAGKDKLNFDLFKNYQEIKLDFCEENNPDIIEDITDMQNIPSNSVDAIWASHVIEHVFWHELPVVFAEIKRILKNDGFGIIMVPNLASIADRIKEKIDEKLYDSPGGPISALDLIYSYREFNKMSMKGMIHKIGFNPKLMNKVLNFCKIENKIYEINFDIVAVIGNLENYTLIEKSIENYYGNKANPLCT